jgi:hypothetical protein
MFDHGPVVSTGSTDEGGLERRRQARPTNAGSTDGSTMDDVLERGADGVHVRDEDW